MSANYPPSIKVDHEALANLDRKSGNFFFNPATLVDLARHM